MAARPAASYDVWQWLTIRAGVPVVTAATQDAFVAQTANWDILGGIDFQKGCYTGQEIIARMQYLGRLKERAFLFHVDRSDVQPGERIFSEAFAGQPCGTVVNAAHAPGGGSDLLVVLQVGRGRAGRRATGRAGWTRARRAAAALRDSRRNGAARTHRLSAFPLSARTSSHYYVYYRVSGNPAVARATVGALIADVEARTGVAGRLLARCDDPRNVDGGLRAGTQCTSICARARRLRPPHRRGRGCGRWRAQE